jgi:hypothetical protein
VCLRADVDTLSSVCVCVCMCVRACVRIIVRLLCVCEC